MSWAFLPRLWFGNTQGYILCWYSSVAERIQSYLSSRLSDTLSSQYAKHLTRTHNCYIESSFNFTNDSVQCSFWQRVILENPLSGQKRPNQYTISCSLIDLAASWLRRSSPTTTTRCSKSATTFLRTVLGYISELLALTNAELLCGVLDNTRDIS